MVGSPYLFIRYLIGRAKKMWSVIYINEKLIYDYKTLACTISKCAILRNVLRVTSTCPFIFWCSGSANIKWTPRVWNYSLNSVKVNCDITSAENISKSHQPNLSIFPDLDWKISSSSITCSVENFSPLYILNFRLGINN